MARIRGAPHPVLFELLYEPSLVEDQRTVLPHLLRIDAAHVLMLARTGILNVEAAGRLLALNGEMTEAVRRGETLFDAGVPHRGLYWLFEQRYVERLGAETGGAAHVARSRNDINATVARMRAREELLALLEDLCPLLETATALALEQSATLMSCFTHQQPAQPSTLGHYLSGVVAELARTGDWLAATYAVVNRSPMGAAAGAGTSFPIDPGQVARRLGFTDVIENSADAVASRDYLVQFLAAAAVLGSTLTRLGTDLQHWASYAYGFLYWPDDLVSTSSIMPQKRNAFVLENIRGQAIQPAAALSHALMAFKNTPFSNGIEVGAESFQAAWPALRSVRKAVRLMTLLLQGIEVRPERMSWFLAGAETTMTALADLLVARWGLAFRTAHDAVGTLLRDLPADAAKDAEILSSRLEAILASAMPDPPRLDREAVKAVLAPSHSMASARYGGGPAPESVRRQLASLSERIADLRSQAALRRQDLAAADRDFALELAAFSPPAPASPH